MLAAPCTYRDLMIKTLDSVRQDWSAACTASSLIGVLAAVAGGLGVTLFGRSCVQASLQIPQAPELWPALAMSEVTVIDEDRARALMRPRIAVQTESLAGSDALASAA